MDNKMKFETPNLTEKNIDKIAELFPSVITESADENGKLKKAINFDMLRQLLSEDIVEGDEAYEFTWVGKKAAIAEANKPIRKTLRPCPEESVNWDTTENLYIEGDNLDVLKLLQESYLGKVKMIYIDPPYNTGNDFIYRDDFKMSEEEYSEEIGEFDEDDNRLFRNTDSNGRFHSDWCSMIYSRLMLARNLLSDDGVIFISIDDNEQENLKKICDEVFGGANFVGQAIWERAFSPKNDAKFLSESHDYIIIYAKNINLFEIGKLPRTAEMNARYKNPDNDPRGAWQSGDLTAKTYSAAYDYPITTPSGNIITPTNGRSWITSKENMQKWIDDGRIWFGENGDNTPRYKRYLSEMTNGIVPTTIWKFSDVGHSQEGRQELKRLFDDKGYFDGPKPVRLLSRILKIANLDKNSIILDFFSGSATTAHAVMRLNVSDGGRCKFIMVQIPEATDEKSDAYKAGYKNICEIGKERIRRVGKIIKEEIETIAPLEKAEQETGVMAAFIDDEAEKYGKEQADKFDGGFRVLKLADSNMTDVYYSPAEYDQSMLDDLESNIKSDRTSLDLLFGCLLEWGLPLSMPYSSEEIEGVTVHTYNDGDLIACFDENISENAVKIIAKRKPLRAVFRDSSFADSPSKINVFEIFKLYAPDTRVKII